MNKWSLVYIYKWIMGVRKSNRKTKSGTWVEIASILEHNAREVSKIQIAIYGQFLEVDRNTRNWRHMKEEWKKNENENEIKWKKRKSKNTLHES